MNIHSNVKYWKEEESKFYVSVWKSSIKINIWSIKLLSLELINTKSRLHNASISLITSRPVIRELNGRFVIQNLIVNYLEPNDIIQRLLLVLVQPHESFHIFVGFLAFSLSCLLWLFMVFWCWSTRDKKFKTNYNETNEASYNNF